MPKYSQQQFRAGYKTISGKTCYFRSGLEVRWARYLQILKELGEILDWHYEPKTFWFEKIKRGTNNYKPDFRVTYIDDHIWQEVKGTGLLKQKDCTKFRRMAKYFPEEKVVLVIQRIVKSNRLLVDRCRQFVAGVIEAEELLKKNGM